MSIVKYWPRWIDEIDDDFMPRAAQKGLKIRETDKNILVEAVVAGVPSDAVEVNIEDGVLTIKAQSKQEQNDKDEFKSMSYQYYYSAALSGGDWHKTEAEVKNGVVMITIPKAEASKPKKITVKAS